MYCRGNNPLLTVTGKNVTWYANEAKTIKLAQGNSYQASLIDTTTTFYIAQTTDGIESAATAIIIEIANPFLRDMKITPASCGKHYGTITVMATGGTAHYPLMFKLNDGPCQTSPVFINLSPGTYVFTFWAAGCFGTIDAVLTQQASPLIAAINSMGPHCGNKDGSILITAYGGSGLLNYLLNGIDFKAENLVDNLEGGVYDITIRDQNSCSVSQQLPLKKSVRFNLNTVDVSATTCDTANGRVEINDAQDNGTITYSLSGLPDQTSTVFDNLQAGNYQLSANDQDGCSYSTAIVVANSQGHVITNLDIRLPTCDAADGRLMIHLAGLARHYYSLDGA